MANHKSAEKRARQSLRRRAVNAKTMAEIRTWERKLRGSIAKKDKKAGEELLIAFMSKIAKAAQKGRVRTETAARKVGRLSKQVASL